MIGNDKWNKLTNQPHDYDWAKGAELDGRGCLRFLHELVYSAVRNKVGKTHKVINRKKDISIAFARNSETLKHFADMFEYDYEKLRKAIVRNNS